MILPQQFLNPKIKPKWWGSLGVVESAIAYNCRIHGFPVPVLAVPFWEGAGNTIYDLSGSQNKGTLINNPYWTSSRSGPAISFDGSNDYLSIANNSSLNGMSQLSISIWVNSGNPTSYDGILDKGASPWATATSDYVVFLDSLEKIAFRLSNGVAEAEANSNVAIATNTWVHIVGVYNGANILLYIDKTLQTDQPALTGSVNSGTQLIYIGNRKNLLQPLAAIIDIPLIFRAAFNQNQINFLHDNPYFMFQPIPVPYGYVAAVGPTIKTVTDVGGGLDILGRLAVSLNLSDSGLGSDSMGGLGAQLDLSDSGEGLDSISQILANLDILDFGQGTDVIPQILITLTIADSGLGTDEIIAGAYKAITDIAQGTDTISSILVSLSVMETGQGTESILISILLNIADVGLGTDIVSNYIFSSISDMASGVEEVSNISVNVPISDTSSGLDAPSQILVTLSISDSGLGIDLISILESLTKIVADSGSGLDSVGSVSVIIPISDSGTGLDTLSALQILLSVLESGHGVETIIRTSPSLPRKMIITFSAKKAGITFN